MKVLIVDDSDLIRRAIRRALALPDAQIEVAASGSEALRVVQQFDPDVVTMDISMPNMDGLTCMEGILRARPSAKILIVSTLVDHPTAVEAMRRGADGFLVKPFTAEALCREIGDLLT